MIIPGKKRNVDHRSPLGTTLSSIAERRSQIVIPPQTYLPRHLAHAPTSHKRAHAMPCPALLPNVGSDRIAGPRDRQIVPRPQSHVFGWMTVREL